MVITLGHSEEEKDLVQIEETIRIIDEKYKNELLKGDVYEALIDTIMMKAGIEKTDTSRELVGKILKAYKSAETEKVNMDNMYKEVINEMIRKHIKIYSIKDDLDLNL